ncbi:MAG TPA: hypothetical protein VK589_30255 [Chryseolinea sp.]|nr:hypothetical protein [Chryseolinea sp.]
MRTKIEKATLKKRMLEACISKHQSLINDLRKRLEAFLVTEGLGNDESYDSGEHSNMAMLVEEVTALTESFRFAEDEMKQLMFLEHSAEETTTRIEPGAAVVTDVATFYISVSIEQFEVDDEKFIGLSVHSPLYIAMKGKDVGDKVSYSGREYRINEIF